MVGLTNAATLSTIEPVVTVILAALVLDEAITPLRIAGGVMILLAVILLTRSRLAAQETFSNLSVDGRLLLHPWCT